MSEATSVHSGAPNPEMSSQYTRTIAPIPNRGHAALIVAVALIAATVTLGLQAPAGARTYPGANGAIVFMRNTPNQLSHVLRINPDGSGLADLGSGGNAAWSADSRMLVFDTGNAFPTSIFEMNADASGRHTVFSAPNNNQNPQNPDLSPDGRRVAFSMSNSTAKSVDIWAINVDGTGLVDLSGSVTGQGGAAFLPVWSPSGTQIAFLFISGPSGGPKIDILNLVTGALSQLPFLAASGPNWKPDGTQLAFGTSNQNGQAVGVACNLDGSGVHAVTPPGGEYPAFSPDGTQVVYMQVTRDAQGRITSSQVAIANADGSGAHMLTNGTDDEVPEWGSNGASTTTTTLPTTTTTTAATTTTTAATTTTTAATTTTTAATTTTTALPATTSTTSPTTSSSSTSTSTTQPPGSTTTSTTTPTGSTTTTAAGISPALFVVGPSQEAPGGQLSLAGQNFPPNAPVALTLFSTPVSLGNVTADGSGRFQTTVTIPADTPLGPHEVLARAGDLMAQTSIVVSAATPPTAAVAGTTLPASPPASAITATPSFTG